MADRPLLVLTLGCVASFLVLVGAGLLQVWLEDSQRLSHPLPTESSAGRLLISEDLGQ